MVERVRKRAVKFRKRIKREDAPVKIEKKPLGPMERRKKLRKDMLKIARRYEKMRLYDDAISYYKKLGLRDDVERLTFTKKEQYQETAKEFEANGKYEDAMRLYENLKMTADVERLNRLMGRDTVIDEKPPDKLPEHSETKKASIPATEPEDEETLADEEELDELEEDDKALSEKLEYIGPTSHKVEPPPVPPANTRVKTFKICPYCGEELNLPKKPNFCPYCKESYV